MIRNGVIDAQKEFGERRYLADADRNFNTLREKILAEQKIDIEICRSTYRSAGQKIFALIGGVLVNTIQNPPLVTKYNQTKGRVGE